MWCQEHSLDKGPPGGGGGEPGPHSADPAPWAAESPEVREAPANHPLCAPPPALFLERSVVFLGARALRKDPETPELPSIAGRNLQ